jgi:hypothetical protein
MKGASCFLWIISLENNLKKWLYQSKDKIKAEEIDEEVDKKN